MKYAVLKEFATDIVEVATSKKHGKDVRKMGLC